MSFHRKTRARRVPSSATAVCWVLATGGFVVLSACGGGGLDEAGGGSGGTSGSSGNGGSAGQTQAVNFSVPESGGAISVPTSSGETLEFAFPASAAGTAVTLTLTTASEAGLPEGQPGQVIDLAPHGMLFEDPIIVRSNGELPVVLHFSGNDPQAAPEMLAANASGDGLELWHFSTLAFMPGVSCRLTMSGRAPMCNSMFVNTSIEQTCTSSDGCFEFWMACCTIPGEFCQYGSNNRTFGTIRNESPGANGRCGGGEGGTGGDAGSGGVGGGSGGRAGEAGTAGEAGQGGYSAGGGTGGDGGRGGDTGVPGGGGMAATGGTGGDGGHGGEAGVAGGSM